MPEPLRAATSVIVEEIDDEVCLYRADTDDVLVLNRSAGDVWHLVDGTLSTDEIVSTLARAYGMAASEIEADVMQVVADLRRRGFVEDEPAGTRP